jgi:lipopolysaccharide export system protein LptA
MRLFITLMVVAIMGAYPAAAQDNQIPLEVSADQSLEWDRTAKTYTATGAAEITQGDVQIKGDKIVADYRESAKSDFDIYKMTATGSVVIINQGSEAIGDVGVYDLDQNMATLTGTNLRMTLPDQIVTAKERFEYNLTTNQVTAIGTAKIVRGDTILESDRLVATLSGDGPGTKAGSGDLQKIDAVGRIKITTPTETLTGERGTYDAKSNRAIVTGNVKITRGPNILTGERAELDMTTNISRMFGSSIEDGQTGGRVRGLFFPKSKESAP